MGTHDALPRRMIFPRAVLPLSALTLLASVASTACSSEGDDLVATVVPSTEVETRALRGTFKLSGERGKATLSAQALFADARRNGTLVTLAGDDAVFCDGVRLAQATTFNGADLPRKPAGSKYRFELRRAGGESVVVEVDAIEEVEVLAPIGSAVHRRTLPLTVTWTPAAGTAIDAQLFSSCAILAAKQDAESGAIALPAFEPRGVPGGPQNAAPAPCDGTVSLVRTRTAGATTALGVTETVAEELHRVPVRVTD
jgi:hypothetical protein